MRKNIIRISITAVLFGISFFIKNDILRIILSISAYIIIGYDILILAVKNMVKGRILDENFLMTIATVGAVAIGETSEAVAVMLFYQVGEFFQNYAVNTSRKSVAELTNIRPDYANKILPDGTLHKCEPFDVAVGDRLKILPSERVPLDCVVEVGNSTVDFSAITGESMPVDAHCGSTLLSGSINLTGVLEATVTTEYSESTVNRILELVENSYEKKAKTEKFITKFARIYTPAVVISAVLIVILLPVFSLSNIQTSFYQALNFLVVSCPCALVISVPMAFFGGIGAASKKGILIKGSGYMEQLARVKTFVFDKTGTITEGKFSVTNIHTFGDITQEKIIALAASAEYASTHPIAMSLKQAYNGKILEISDLQEIHGKGISANCVEGRLLVGNKQLLLDNNISFPDNITEYGTYVYVALENICVGIIVISDKIKQNAQKSIKELHTLGVESCVMLSGDLQHTAQQVSKEVGIDKTYAQLLPHQKLEHLEKLLSDKHSTAYVGDGTNDAPVLARADIGIAMGIVGTSAAIEAADIVITGDDLEKLPEAIKISRNTITIVFQNIVFAIGIKIAVLILSLLNISNLWIAIFADVGVSVLAIINSLRTLYSKKI